MNDHVVSVILPSYNHEDFIIDCLKSIHSQTYENIELIAIDDNSRDKTFDIIQSFGASIFGNRFSRIVIEQNEQNLGAHASINRAINLSSGKFISIINSDDCYHHERVERLLSALDASSARFAFSQCLPVFDDEDQIDIGSILLTHTPDIQLHTISRWPNLGYSLLRRNVGVTTGNFLFERSLFDQVGPFVPLRYCHDWDFVLQSTRYTEPLFVPEPLYYYRIHQGNSFQAYDDIAVSETAIVRERFFQAIARYDTRNPNCVSPYLQPGYFQLTMKEMGLEDVWKRVANENIYWHRTYEGNKTRKKPAFSQLTEAVNFVSKNSSQLHTFR